MDTRNQIGVLAELPFQPQTFEDLVRLKDSGMENHWATFPGWTWHQGGDFSKSLEEPVGTSLSQPVSHLPPPSPSVGLGTLMSPPAVLLLPDTLGLDVTMG